jgi:hypothetical protein
MPAPATPPTGETAFAAPPDFMLRANELLATQIPRIAQRAERMVLRVLVAAAHADEDGSNDDEVRLAAGAIRLAPDDPQLTRAAVRESRQFHEGARIALQRAISPRRWALQTRAFAPIRSMPRSSARSPTCAFARPRVSPRRRGAWRCMP